MSLGAIWRALFDATPLNARIEPASAALGGSDNAILNWLDAAGLPWRDTRAELASRFGVNRTNPYRWDLVPLEVDPPPLEGLLYALGFQMFERYSPRLPPGVISGHVHLGEDTEVNIRAAAGHFAAALGAREVADRYNTRTAGWRCGPASVTLTVWPARMQTGPRLTNPAHDREPRLATACSVSIQTGWRPPLAPRERAWLDGFRPMGPTINWTPARPRPFDPDMAWYREAEVEFTRAPPADVARFAGSYGLSSDGAALVFCTEALHVIELAAVTRFDVARTLPAKGGGGSRLLATCLTGYPACPTKQVEVAKGEKPDDLNAAGASLAAAAGKPFALGEPDYDV